MSLRCAAASTPDGFGNPDQANADSTDAMINSAPAAPAQRSTTVPSPSIKIVAGKPDTPYAEAAIHDCDSRSMPSSM